MYYMMGTFLQFLFVIKNIKDWIYEYIKLISAKQVFVNFLNKFTLYLSLQTLKFRVYFFSLSHVLNLFVLRIK